MPDTAFALPAQGLPMGSIGSPRTAVYRGRFCSFGEAWFVPPHAAPRVDVLTLRQVARPNGTAAPFATLLIDLTHGADDLLRAMKKDCQQHIRKASKDALAFEIMAPYQLKAQPAVIAEFARYYGAFAKAKGLPQVNPDYLLQLARADLLWFTRARKQGDTLAWHSIVVNAGRARVLFGSRDQRSVSAEYDKATSRANRWLVWQSIQAFKAQGNRWFDLGGWYEGDTHAGLLGINQFKAGFGGTLVREYDCQMPLTLLGRAYCAGSRLARRLKAALAHARDRKSTRLNSSHVSESRMPSSA